LCCFAALLGKNWRKEEESARAEQNDGRRRRNHKERQVSIGIVRQSLSGQKKINSPTPPSPLTCMPTPAAAAGRPVPEHVVKHVVGALAGVVRADPGLLEQVGGHRGAHQRVGRVRAAAGLKLERNELPKPRRVVVPQGFGVPEGFKHGRGV
jgi:hypothetical protein